MRQSKIAWLSALALGVAVVGCDSKTEEKTTTETKTTSGDAADKMKSGADKMKDAADKGMDKAKDVGKDVKDAAKEGVDKAKDAGGDAADKSKDVLGGAVDKAKEGAAAAGGDVAESNANSMLDKAMGLIKDSKLSDAETLLDKVEAMKDKLPASVQPRIAQVRSALDAAKKGGALMPH